MKIRSVVWLVVIGLGAVVLLDVGTNLPTPDDRSRTRRTVPPRTETASAHTDANEPQSLLTRACDLTKNNRYASALALLKQLQQEYPSFQPDKVSAAIDEFTLAKAEHDKEREKERAKQEAEYKQLSEQRRLEEERLAREKKEAFARAGKRDGVRYEWHEDKAK